MSFDPLDHDLLRGLDQRRAVLGDAWVERSLANANTFTADFQNFITRYARMRSPPPSPRSSTVCNGAGEVQGAV